MRLFDFFRRPSVRPSVRPSGINFAGKGGAL